MRQTSDIKQEAAQILDQQPGFEIKDLPRLILRVQREERSDGKKEEFVEALLLEGINREYKGENKSRSPVKFWDVMDFLALSSGALYFCPPALGATIVAAITVPRIISGFNRIIKGSPSRAFEGKILRAIESTLANAQNPKEAFELGKAMFASYKIQGLDKEEVKNAIRKGIEKASGIQDNPGILISQEQDEFLKVIKDLHSMSTTPGLSRALFGLNAGTIRAPSATKKGGTRAMTR